MTLNVNKPTDQELVAALPAYIRSGRVAMNALMVEAGFAVTNLGITAGATSLTVGNELVDTEHEIIIVTGLGASTLASILSGMNGYMKIFIFQDSNISLTDGVKSAGKFYLNQLPALTDFHPNVDDVLILINIGGDVVSHGYWKEIYRSISVK